ncbi:glycine zipper domain-containing protein, partial [Escherichia coli]
LQEQLCEEVKAKPMQSVAIAAGIGFLLGVICRR